MSLVKDMRAALARALSPEAFKRVENEAQSRGLTPNQFNRAAASAYWFYEGIRQSRDRSRIPFQVGDSKDFADSWTRLEHLNIARFLYANDGLTRGFINDLARYTVGTGIRPQAITSDSTWNDEAEAYWDDWCYRADFGGVHHFDWLQFMWQIGEARDGDIGIVLTDDGAGDPRVQTIRGHRIGNVGPDSAQNLTDGVRTDGMGRVISYRIDLGNGQWREIPSRSFILHYEPQDPDALRGLTVLHSGINHVRDKKDILGFEKAAVKVGSVIPAVLKTRSGDVDPSEWNDDDPAAGADPTKLTLAQMASGQIPVIGNDEDLQSFANNRPSPAFTGFLEFLIREIALGGGLPMEFIWHAEKLGGAPMRFVLQKAQRRFNERRSLFIRRVLRRVWGYVISNAIQRGKLRPNDQFNRVAWQVPADLSVDAGRDQAQDREDVKMGLITEADHYGMRGLDWKEKRDQVEREADDLLERAGRISKKRGVSVEAALALLRQSTPNGGAVQQPAKPAPAP